MPNHPGAQAAEDCETCKHSKTGGRRECPRYWEHIARSQGASLIKLGETHRAKIREVYAEQAKADAAHDLAEQYARKLGIDLTRHDVLRYTKEYWEQRTKFERTWTELEGFRWDAYQLVTQLRDALVDGRVEAATPSRKLAESVIKYLTSHPTFGGSTKRRPELFERPTAPGL